MSDEPINLPHYPQPPPGLPVANRDEAKPLIKMISKMLKPPQAPRRGKIQAPQTVKIGHRKKTKFY